MGHTPGSKARPLLVISESAGLGMLLARRSRMPRPETEPASGVGFPGIHREAAENRPPRGRRKRTPRAARDVHLGVLFPPPVLVMFVAVALSLVYIAITHSHSYSVATEVGQHIKGWYADGTPGEELSVRAVGDAVLVGDDVTIARRGTHIDPVIFTEADRDSWCFEAPRGHFVSYLYSAGPLEAVKGRCPA